MKKNNKININEALLRKLIQERLKAHLEEELLEEGLIDSVRNGIAIMLMSYFGEINTAGAVTPNQVADALADKMPSVSKVEYFNENNIDEFVFTENTGETYRFVLTNKDKNKLLELNKQDLKDIINKSIDTDSDTPGSVADFSDAISNLKGLNKKIDKEKYKNKFIDSGSDFIDLDPDLDYENKKTYKLENFKYECMSYLNTYELSHNIEYKLLKYILEDSVFYIHKDFIRIERKDGKRNGNNFYDERDKLDKLFGVSIDEEEVNTEVLPLDVRISPKLFIDRYIKVISNYLEKEDTYMSKSDKIYNIAFQCEDFNKSESYFNFYKIEIRF